LLAGVEFNNPPPSPVILEVVFTANHLTDIDKQNNIRKHKVRNTDSATYYPLKKQRSLIRRPSTAITDGGDENAFTGPKGFSGCAAQLQ